MKQVFLAFPSAGGIGLKWFFGHASLRRYSLMPSILLVVASGLLVFVAIKCVEHRQKLIVVHHAAAVLQSQRIQLSRAANTTPPKSSSLSAVQTQAWNQLVRQLNTPWSTVLDALETATPDDVAVVFIEPDSRQSHLLLQAEARTLDALLAYSRSLKASPVFSEVRLIKHETQEQDLNRPLRLSMELHLKEPMR